MPRYSATSTNNSLRISIDPNSPDLQQLSGQVEAVIRKRVLSVAISKAITKFARKNAPVIADILENEFKNQFLVENINNPQSKLYGALGIPGAYREKEQLISFFSDGLIRDASGVGKGGLAPFVSSGGANTSSFARSAIFGLKSGFQQDLMSQSFGSYVSESKKKSKSQYDIPWLSWLIDPSRGRISGFRLIEGEPSDSSFSASRTGYALMKFGGSFSLKSSVPDIPSGEKKFGILGNLFSDKTAAGKRVRRKVDQLLNKEFEDIIISEVDKAISRVNRSARVLRATGGGEGTGQAVSQAVGDTGVVSEEETLENLREVILALRNIGGETANELADKLERGEGNVSAEFLSSLPTG